MARLKEALIIPGTAEKLLESLLRRNGLSGPIAMKTARGIDPGMMKLMKDIVILE